MRSGELLTKAHRLVQRVLAARPATLGRDGQAAETSWAVRDGEIVLELRGDTLYFSNHSAGVGGALRTFALVLGRSPRKVVPYRELNAAVYDEQFGKNTERLRQLATELRRRLATLGLTPGNEYLPQGNRQGYVLMVEIRESVSAPGRPGRSHCRGQTKRRRSMTAMSTTLPVPRPGCLP